jgi:formate-dependent phosphoribosylglycinamide formyltransferase (GAR transformylase)
VPKDVTSHAPLTATPRNAIANPKVLLATTGQLPSTARLAMELHDAGAEVALISAGNHPARVLAFLAQCHTYRATNPGRSLQKAIRRSAPDLIIPCDERAVRDLHQLWRSTRDPAVRTVIEESVGPATSFPIVTSRHALLSLAAKAGVRVPESAPVPNIQALNAWIETHPTPFVLKADGSWAGFGVRIISDTSAARSAFTQMRKSISLRLALRETVLEGDHFALRSWVRHELPTLSVQAYVDGWPANIGVACWKGEVVAATCAESVATESATGPSTVARVIDNAEMLDAARTVVAALGISGLVGFDFMIEAATGHAYMIEMNPRNTPICAIRLASPRDLPEALTARIAGRSLHERPPRTERDIIVFFPDTWRRDPSNQFLHSGFHDVPWEQPELVRVLMRPEMRDRYWIMRLARKAWLKAAAASSR